jgi:hypothetical protein
MPQIKIDQIDAAELAELLTFLAGWHTADRGALEESLGRYLGTSGYDLNQLAQDLHRFAFLLGATDGERLFS